MTLTESSTITDDATLREILEGAQHIALVGASEKPWRDSHSIMEYLLRTGYTVTPVNPNYTSVQGLPCLPNLHAVRRKIDIVSIFRNPHDVLPAIIEAVAVRAGTVWMQTGIVHVEGAAMALRAGLFVVMDRCIAVDHRRLCHAR